MTPPTRPQERPHRFMDPCGSLEGTDSCWFCYQPRADRRHLDPDPLTVEPEPVERPKPAPIGLVRWGCGICLGIWIAALVLVGSIILDATPRSGQTTIDPPRDLSGLRVDASAALSGAPHDPLPVTQGLGAPSAMPTPMEVDVAAGRRPETTKPSPASMAAALRSDANVSQVAGNTGRPEPAAIGSAVFQASATWCAPTPTKCRRWGGTARLAALPTYAGIPYVVRVAYRDRSVDVIVVSWCSGCGIDLSPYAFSRLAPLARGRIDVEVEGPIAPLPATDGEP